MTEPASWRLRLRRLRTDGLARESTWSLTYEIAVLSSSLVSFMLLGRNLGAEGYGGYASLFAIISPLLTLAGSGLTLSLLQHTVQGREPLASTARSCLSLALLVGLGLTVVASAICLAVVPALPVIAVISLLCTEFLVMPAVHIAAATSQIASGFVAAARTRLVFVFIRTGIILGLALTGQLTIVSFAALTLAAGVVTALLTMRFVASARSDSLDPPQIECHIFIRNFRPGTRERRRQACHGRERPRRRTWSVLGRLSHCSVWNAPGGQCRQCGTCPISCPRARQTTPALGSSDQVWIDLRTLRNCLRPRSLHHLSPRSSPIW